LKDKLTQSICSRLINNYCSILCNTRTAAPVLSIC